MYKVKQTGVDGLPSTLTRLSCLSTLEPRYISKASIAGQESSGRTRIAMAEQAALVVVSASNCTISIEIYEPSDKLHSEYWIQDYDTS